MAMYSSMENFSNRSTLTALSVTPRRAAAHTTPQMTGPFQVPSKRISVNGV